MAASSRYCVPLRRRREGKTDYRIRRAFVISGKPRFVARGTLRNVVVQIVASKPHGDEVLVSAHSRELEKFGWKAPRGNIPSAYLTGLLCGLKAKTQGVEEVVLDVGLHSPSKGARVFAVLKGVLDAGIKVPHSEEKLPEEGRIGGKHVADYAKSLTPNSETYQAKFSGYLRQELPPENLPKHVAEVKKAVVAAFKKGGKKT